MKFHWGHCNEENYYKELLKEKAMRAGLIIELKSTQDVNNTLTQKIQHLEQVISDYQKAALIQEAPLYVEMAPVIEQPKQKRIRKP